MLNYSLQTAPEGETGFGDGFLVQIDYHLEKIAFGFWRELQ